MRVVLASLLLFLLALPAAADDLYPPPWRDMANTTWQSWTFDNAVTGQFVAPESSHNPYGAPTINDSYPNSREWLATHEGRQGVYDFFWYFFIDLPNVPLPNEYKEIYVQWTYYVDNEDPYYFGGPPRLEVALPSTPYTNQVTRETQLQLESTDNGTWWYERWQIFIWPNPEFESLYVRALNDYDELFFDQIIIDTRCIPEPASVLLALTALLLRRR